MGYAAAAGADLGPVSMSALSPFLLLAALALQPVGGSELETRLDRGGGATTASWTPLGGGARGCAPGSEYYRIPLVSTRRVPGSARATGAAEVIHSESPFGLSIVPDGSYDQRLEISIEALQPARQGGGAYVVWVSTPNLDRVELLGTLDNTHRIGGRVHWNKFLVVISLEENPEALGPKWSGPIVLRGMSRSGFMHTLAGHGPFEVENCVAAGYNY